MVKRKQNRALRNKTCRIPYRCRIFFYVGKLRSRNFHRRKKRDEKGKKIARRYFPRTLRGLCSLCTPEEDLRMVSPKACSPILAEIRALPRGRPTIKQRRGVRGRDGTRQERKTGSHESLDARFEPWRKGCGCPGGSLCSAEWQLRVAIARDQTLSKGNQLESK